MVPLPPSPDPIVAAVTWLGDVLTGTLATSIGVLAVGMLGFEFLRGSIRPRRAIQVLLGCFVLFGVRPIAEEIAALARNGGEQVRPAAPQPTVPDSAAPRVSPGLDPYSGASVPSAESQSH